MDPKQIDEEGNMASLKKVQLGRVSSQLLH